MRIASDSSSWSAVGKYESAGMKRSSTDAQDSLLPSWSKREQHESTQPSTRANPSDHQAAPAILHQCPEPECGRRFNRKYTLMEHLKTHTGEKPHVCPAPGCSKRFSTSGNLARHKRLHGFIKPLECPVDGCMSTFPSDNKLEKHMKYHLGSAVHVCKIGTCGKTFSTMGNLNRHMKNHHAEFLREQRHSIDHSAIEADEGEDEEEGSEVDSDTFGSELQPRPTPARPAALAHRQHEPHNSGNPDQLDVLASILHEEIDFVEPSAGDAPAASAAAASAAKERDEEKSDESEPESPNRKRRRTILDDMISFHVTHFGN